MATKRAVAQLKFVAQKRPEICSRIQQTSQPVPGCCRCKSSVRYVKQPQRQPPHVKKKMSMTEKVAKKTQYSLENSVTPLLSDEELKHVFSTDLFVFRCDVTTGGQVESAMGLYNKTLSEIGILTSNDISNLARGLHYKFRQTRDKDVVIAHIRTLIKDLKTKKIPGHPLASVHILSCLKEMQAMDEAIQFWNWLQEQDSEHLDSRVVGAVIEVLSMQGEELPKLEYMFREALKEYAVSMDDGGALNHRATRIMLLQGIITARLLHGEWRRAYDGLDIILQLHPVQTPARVFELFIFQRPVMEGYVVFLMACRTGQVLSQRVTTYIMKTWIDETKDVLGLLRMLYSYVGAGGKPSYEHMNIIVTALLKFIPNFRLFKNKSEQDLRVLNSHSQNVLMLVKKFISAFQQIGVQPNRATYNTIINEAGKLGNVQLVTATLETMVQSKLSPDLITNRILVATFGLLNSKQQVEASWHGLRSMRMEMYEKSVAAFKDQNSGDPKKKIFKATMPKWELKDWKALAKACVYCDHLTFLKDQLQRYGHEIPAFMQDSVLKYATNVATELEEKPEQPTSLEVVSSVDSVLNLSGTLEKATVDFDMFRSITTSASAHDFTSTPIAFSDIPGYDQEAVKLTIPDEDLQNIYGRFMSSRASPFLSNSYKVGVDYQDPQEFVKTGFKIGQLRFENWMSVNKLLFLAETGEIEKINSVLEKKQAEEDGTSAEPKKAVEGTKIKRAFATESHSQLMNTRKKTLLKQLKSIERKLKEDEDAWDEIAVFRAGLVGGATEDPLKSLQGEDYLTLRKQAGKSQQEVKDSAKELAEKM